jgi:Ran GTPase-activating protein (RanGAP) involved in mRNA processing and transport
MAGTFPPTLQSLLRTSYLDLTGDTREKGDSRGGIQGDEGCRAVVEALRSKDKKTTSLDLFDIDAGDSGVEILAEAFAADTSVRVVRLSENRIGDKGATALAAALGTNSQIEELLLDRNSIGDEGAQALGACLSKNHTLKKLSLSGNPISDIAGMALCAGLAANDSLTVLELNETDVDLYTVEEIQSLLKKRRAAEAGNQSPRGRV